MLDIVTAGEAYDDLVFHSLDALPKPGQELKTDAFVRSPGGGAVITAIAASRLGLKAAVVSGLSDDAVRVLRAEHVAVKNLRRNGEAPALTVALSTRRDRRFITYPGMNGRLPARIRTALGTIRARHVHMAFPPTRCSSWTSVVRALRRRRVTTSWDFGYNPSLRRDPDFLTLVRELDYLFLNQTETLLYARRSAMSAAIPVWRELPHHVIIRLGAHGCRAVGGGVDVRVPAHRVRAIDTTGAGDAFNAGFLAARLRGLDLEASLRHGNRIGASSVRRAGGIAGLPRRNQVS